MFRAMVLKEWRETRGIALLAMAAYVVVIWWQLTVLKSRADTIPFVTDGFMIAYVVVSAALAAALGLRQTLGESVVGTYPFLYHRPATRQWIIGVKLFMGLAIYLACAVVPVVVYGVIAASPGVHASPFFWATTLPAWMAWLIVTVVYFGAFLSGIRPARWFFSRLFPLVGAGLAAFLPALLYNDLAHGPPAVLIIVVLMDVWGVATILFMARSRDYA